MRGLLEIDVAFAARVRKTCEMKIMLLKAVQTGFYACKFVTRDRYIKTS